MSYDITDEIIKTFPEEYREDLLWAKTNKVRINFLDYKDFCLATQYLNDRKFNRFLELGVLHGGSILLLSHYINNGGAAIGVDNLSALSNNPDDIIVNILHKRILPVFDRISNTKEINTQFVRSSSTEWLLSAHEKFDLIHIDAGHTVEDFLRDFLLSYDRLSENGMLLIDDCSILHTGVVRGSAIGWRIISELISVRSASENCRYGCVDRNLKNDSVLLPLIDMAKAWPLGL